MFGVVNTTQNESRTIIRFRTIQIPIFRRWQNSLWKLIHAYILFGRNHSRILNFYFLYGFIEGETISQTYNTKSNILYVLQERNEKKQITSMFVQRRCDLVYALCDVYDAPNNKTTNTKRSNIISHSLSSFCFLGELTSFPIPSLLPKLDSHIDGIILTKTVQDCSNI